MAARWIVLGLVLAAAEALADEPGSIATPNMRVP
jgi:hypothetical protein